MTIISLTVGGGLICGANGHCVRSRVAEARKQGRRHAHMKILPLDDATVAESAIWLNVRVLLFLPTVTS